MRVLLCAAAVTLCLASQAMAAFDLQITEIWMGNEPGENLTDDWFEITNIGTMPWTAAIDGDLYFDDDSFDSTTADLMSGILSIGPGESVVFVDGSAAVGGLNTFIWADLWGPALAAAGKALPQIGTYEGAGLGQGGDAIGIWISAAPPVGLPDFTGSYPDANSNGGQSYDLVLGAFSTVGNSAGAVATAVNDANQPAIGSPGSISPIVPEPASIILVGMSVVLLAAKRR